MPFSLVTNHSYTIEGAQFSAEPLFHVNVSDVLESSLERTKQKILNELSTLNQMKIHDILGNEISRAHHHLGLHVVERDDAGDIKRIFFAKNEAHMIHYLRKKFPDVNPINFIPEDFLSNPSELALPLASTKAPGKKKIRFVNAKKSIIDSALNERFISCLQDLMDLSAAAATDMPDQLRAEVNSLKMIFKNFTSKQLTKVEMTNFKIFYDLARKIDKHRPNAELGAHNFDQQVDEVSYPSPSLSEPAASPSASSIDTEDASVDDDMDPSMVLANIDKNDADLQAFITAVYELNLTQAGSQRHLHYLNIIRLMLSYRNFYERVIATPPGSTDVGFTSYLYALKYCDEPKALGYFYDAIRRSGYGNLLLETLVSNPISPYRGWSALMIAAYFNTPEILTDMLEQAPQAKSKLFSKTKANAVNRRVKNKTILDHLCHVTPVNNLDSQRIVDNAKILQRFGADITAEMSETAKLHNPLLAEYLLTCVTAQNVEMMLGAGASAHFFNPSKKRVASRISSANVKSSSKTDAIDDAPSSSVAKKARPPAKP